MLIVVVRQRRIRDRMNAVMMQITANIIVHTGQWLCKQIDLGLCFLCQNTKHGAKKGSPLRHCEHCSCAVATQLNKLVLGNRYIPHWLDFRQRKQATTCSNCVIIQC